MASGCAVRVLPCALVLFVLLSWLKHDLSTTPKEDSATPSPDTSSFLTPSEGPYVQPTAESVRFEDPPSPCNDVAEIVEGAEKSSHLHLQTVPSANLHVFSAFIDTRLSQEAVIIGATLHPDPELFADLMCLFVDGFNVWRSTASVHIESEYPGLSTNHHSLFIRCSVSVRLSPSAKVGLTFNHCDRSEVYLPLHRIPHPSQVAHSSGLELCVTPLPLHFNQSGQLVDFVELHLHMGVKHFSFYSPDHIGSGVKSHLASYVTDGVASVIPWNNPVSTAPFYGDVVAMQDCLYRRMNLHNPFLGFVGINEAILPASKPFNHSLSALVRTSLAKELGRAAIRIRHRHPSAGARDFKSQPRSQWIVRSNLVLSMQAHWVGSFFRGVGHDVPARHALVRPLEHWTHGALTREMANRVAHSASLRKRR